MTLTLLDLYNSTASQEWAMYDNDAISDTEFEDSLVLALNKSIMEIYSSYPFSFRERTHLILTLPKVNEYDMPTGLIMRNSKGEHLVKYNSSLLKLIEEPECICANDGMPNGFYIKNNKLVLYPVPQEKGLVTIDYLTLVIGETIEGKEIYTLKNDNDSLLVPTYLEELMKEAIITRTMINTIASETDENFAAYKAQADRAYKMLIKYARGVQIDKAIKF